MKKLLLLFIIIIFLSNFSFSQCPSWTQKANFGGTARYGAVGFSIGAKGYIGTGIDASGFLLQDFWEWDQITNVWTQKANFGGLKREYAVGFSIGTKGYIGTGDDTTGQRKNDFWEWNQATNTWTQKANFGGTARDVAVGFSIGTKGYIGTGDDVGGFKQDFWEWDQSTNLWTQKANFGGTGRFSAVGFSIGTKGYIGTGDTTGGNCLNDFWEWNQATNLWTQKANFGGLARERAIGFSIGTKGYIGTGVALTYYQDFWEWDQSTNLWTQKANFGGVARQMAVGFSIGAKGYIGTGMDASGIRHQDFWEYDAPSTAPISVCLTTVDSFSTKNIIVWDKPVSTTIDSFRIYRDSGTSYLPVVTLPYSSLSSYTDNVNPNIHSYDYKISVIDNMGVESALSDRHQTMFLQKTQTAPPAFNLTWTDYCGFPVTKYYILRDGNNTNTWVKIDSVNFGTNIYVDNSPPTQNSNYRIEATDPQVCIVSLKNQIPMPMATTIKGTKSNTSYKVFGAGINEIENELQVNIYPNPNNGQFNILGSNFKIQNVEIFNLYGEKIFSQIVNNKSQNISCDLQNGIYFLKVISDKGIAVKKIIINR